jgi:hypothetical protein
MHLRSIAKSPCTKWIALLLVLLPLAWPATRLAEVSSNDDLCRVCQDGDTPAALPTDRFALQAPGACGDLPAEEARVRCEVFDLSSLTYRGPPAR